jgi:hypothetical protein
MNNQFLRDLQVTAEELKELQRNERPFGLLSERQRETLNTGRGNGTQWYGYKTLRTLDRCYDACDPDYTYRLHPDLTLHELLQRPSDPKEPFRWTFSDMEVWCCPVYEEAGQILFMRKRDDYSHFVSLASSFIGFCGVASADDDGLPCDMRWSCDISNHLARHHRGANPLDFVCFRVEDNQ